MSDHSSSASSSDRNGALRVFVNVLAALGVLLIGASAMALSYFAFYDRAAEAGVADPFTYLYPGVFALLLLLCFMGSYVLRRGKRSHRISVEFLILLLIATGLLSAVEEYLPVAMDARTESIVFATIPWVALLLGVAVARWIDIELRVRRRETPAPAPTPAARPREAAPDQSAQHGAGDIGWLTDQLRPEDTKNTDKPDQENKEGETERRDTAEPATEPIAATTHAEPAEPAAAAADADPPAKPAKESKRAQRARRREEARARRGSVTSGARQETSRESGQEETQQTAPLTAVDAEAPTEPLPATTPSGAEDATPDDAAAQDGAPQDGAPTDAPAKDATPAATPGSAAGREAPSDEALPPLPKRTPGETAHQPRRLAPIAGSAAAAAKGSGPAASPTAVPDAGHPSGAEAALSPVDPVDEGFVPDPPNDDPTTDESTPALPVTPAASGHSPAAPQASSTPQPSSSGDRSADAADAARSTDASDAPVVELPSRPLVRRPRRGSVAAIPTTQPDTHPSTEPPSGQVRSGPTPP